MHTTETVAAPNLLYVPEGGSDQKGIYYLATEIYPNRYNDKQQGDWQVKVFYAQRRRRAVPAGRPAIRCRPASAPVSFSMCSTASSSATRVDLDHATDKWQMEVLSTPLPN